MPEFIKIFEDIIVEAEGEQVEMSCTVSGTPDPSILWLFNGKTLQLSDEIQSKIDGNIHTLLISSFKAKFCGVFTAIAQNMYGEVHCSAGVAFKKVNFCRF
jgi:hypothetical protein